MGLLETLAEKDDAAESILGTGDSYDDDDDEGLCAVEGAAGEEGGDFDYILDEIVGGGGWWQWKKCLLLIPSYLTNGVLPLLLHLFTAYTPPHRCFVDGCDVAR